MTSAEQTYRFYNRSPDYLARLESAGWRPEYGAVLDVLRRHRVTAQSQVLDYGCGVGDLAATLTRAGYWACGADVSVPFVQRARARYQGSAFVALDMGPALPFADGQFAAVTAVNTIEHVVRPAMMLKELVRVLRTDGLLVMTLPNLLSPLRPLRRFLVKTRRAHYGPESGDTAREALGLLARNLALLTSISISRRPQFRPRQADFANAERYRLLGYGADYDAVWLSNPADITWRLRELGMRVLKVRGIPGAAERWGAINHLRQLLPPPLTSPILLVAQKRNSGLPLNV